MSERELIKRRDRLVEEKTAALILAAEYEAYAERQRKRAERIQAEIDIIIAHISAIWKD